ncbi:MAG: CYTH and CHAD domain-containing protein [Candidatus Nanopelagicales bacterium]
MTTPSAEDPTPPDTRAAELPDDPADEIIAAPEEIAVTPPVDVVSVDHAEPAVEPPQVYEVADAQPNVVRRLRVHGLFRMPDLQSAAIARVDREPVRTMQSTYVDTADLRLARWGVTLRRHDGDQEQGWVLTLPGDDVVTAALSDEVPPELRSLTGAFARSAPLTDVATLRTERTPHVLFDATDRPVGQVLDDTVSLLDGEHIAARFREVEVAPLTDGPSLEPVVSILRAAGAAADTTTATDWVLGPGAHEAADVPEPGDVGPKDPAGEAITAHLRRHARALLLQDVRVRRDLPDSVHQMRVAARRLRSGLKAFEPLLDYEWAEGLRTELGWVAGELGVSRDTEVLQARIDEHADEVGEPYAASIRAVVDPALSDQWRDARDHALAAMASPRYEAFLEQLTQAAARPRLLENAGQPAEDVLPALVEKAWNKLRKEVKLLELDGPSDVWHEARIRAKKARYAAEAVAPVMGDHVKKFAKALSGVTELLGEHQDAWVAQNTLRELAGRPDVDGMTGFSLGLLHQFEFEQEMFARTDFVELWPDIKHAHKKARLG